MAAALGGMVLFSGCSGISALSSGNLYSGATSAPLVEAAAAGEASIAQFSSVAGSVVTPEPTQTPEPTPEPSPTVEAVQTDVEQLQFDANYMQPRGLDGIDPYNDKIVALTFDDGPTGNTTPELLDILKENDVNATFFMIGENVAAHPEVVKRAYEEGNEIGTHSWNHAKNFLKWSADEVLDQITRTNDAIEDATGLRAIIDRPPEGAINAEVAGTIGRMQILWDVDPNDWKTENRDPDIVYDNVVNGGELHNGAVVLSHDIRPTTVQAYDRIIKELKSEGYKFVTVTQLIQIAELRGKDFEYIFNGAPSAVSTAEPSEETPEEA